MNKTKILYLIYYLLLFALTIISIKNNYPNTFISIVAIFTCLILPLLFKCFKLKMTFNMHIFNLIFIFISNVWGSMLDGYSINYFDKILHFSSGLLLTELSFMIYVLLMKRIKLNRNELFLCILFINAMNMLIAVYWEFVEFAGLIFLNHDAIHHYDSGVYDCIQDMLVACLGGYLVSVFLILDFKRNKKSIFYKEMIKLMKINHFH